MSAKCSPDDECVVTYVATIPLQFQIVGQGEKVDIRLGQDLEIAGSLRKVGNKLDRLGPGVSELEERRQGSLKAGSCRLIANYTPLAPEQGGPGVEWPTYSQ